MNKKNIFWISSYPKSGNTWMRSILSSIMYTDDGVFNFDLLKNIDQYENSKNFKFIKNIDKDDYNNLNKMEIVSKYWKESQKRISEKNKNIFLKSHSANYNHNNLNYLNLDHFLGAIYIIRDPRDVAISYSNHIGQPIDEVIKMMIQSNQQIYNPNKSVGVILSRWDFHVISWTKINYPKLIIKYEELLDNTEDKIDEIINFLENCLNTSFNFDSKKKFNIIKSTSFDKLKNDENKNGFIESSKKNRFFRVGKKMQWKTALNKEQILIIEKTFSETMKSFGYL